MITATDKSLEDTYLQQDAYIIPTAITFQIAPPRRIRETIVFTTPTIGGIPAGYEVFHHPSDVFSIFRKITNKYGIAIDSYYEISINMEIAFKIYCDKEINTGLKNIDIRTCFRQLILDIQSCFDGIDSSNTRLKKIVLQKEIEMWYESPNALMAIRDYLTMCNFDSTGEPNVVEYRENGVSIVAEEVEYEIEITGSAEKVPYNKVRFRIALGKDSFIDVGKSMKHNKIKEILDTQEDYYPIDAFTNYKNMKCYRYFMDNIVKPLSVVYPFDKLKTLLSVQYIDLAFFEKNKEVFSNKAEDQYELYHAMKLVHEYGMRIKDWRNRMVSETGDKSIYKKYDAMKIMYLLTLDKQTRIDIANFICSLNDTPLDDIMGAIYD